MKKTMGLAKFLRASIMGVMPSSGWAMVMRRAAKASGKISATQTMTAAVISARESGPFRLRPSCGGMT